jgi:hypothetical protein
MNSHSYNETFEDKRSELARCVSRPDIYRANSFRILDIPVNASPKDIAKRIKDLNLQEKIGEYNNQVAAILPLTPLPDSTIRNGVSQRLSNPESRLIDEMFWFWPLSSKIYADADEALNFMKQGSIDKAISIWEKYAKGENESNTAKHNLAVLYHTLALDLEHISKKQKLSDEQLTIKRIYWKNALSYWKDVFTHDWLTQRISERIIEINDPRLNKDDSIKIKECLPIVVLSINASLAMQAAQKSSLEEASFHLGLLLNSGFDRSIIDQTTLFVVNPLREQVKAICSDIKSKSFDKPENNDKLAMHLEQQVSPILSTLDTVLLKGKPIRLAVHDEIASTMVDLIHTFAEKTEEWKAALKVLRKAEKIAESELLLKRIRNMMETAEQNLSLLLCWFCQKNARTESATINVKMYGNVQKIGNSFTGGKVTWQHLEVKVPRCKRCSSVHSKRTAGAWITGLTCAFLGALVGWLVLENGWAIAISIVALIVGRQIGLVLNPLPKGIKNHTDYKQFPVIKNLLLQGWAFGEKPSGVS